MMYLDYLMTLSKFLISNLNLIGLIYSANEIRLSLQIINQNSLEIYTIVSELDTILGYIISMVLPLATPVIAFLFLSGALLKVVKEVHALVLLNEVLTDSLTEEEKIAHANQIQLKRETIVLNLTQAIIFTAAIAVWLFVPGGWIVPVVVISVLALTLLTKNAILYVEKQRLDTQPADDRVDIKKRGIPDGFGFFCKDYGLMLNDTTNIAFGLEPTLSV